MNIAIIGSGFSGLSLVFFLQKISPSISCTLFDFRGIGEGASGKASGLVHPYAGKRAHFSYKAEIAFPEALQLINEIDAISRNQEHESVILQKGILRPAITSLQELDFKKRSEENYLFPAFFLSQNESSDIYPNPKNLPSLYIPEGLAINSVQYLKVLFKVCSEKNLIYKKEKIESLDILKEQFDHVIVCGGYETKEIFPKKLQTNNVKGQRIDIALPNNFIKPIHAISAGAYAAFSENRVCLGSTYEHFFTSDEPNENEARKEIEPKISQFWPELIHSQTLSIAAGIRSTTSSSRPIVTFHQPSIWAITGLGSKGLLYHAWLSRCVALTLTQKISLLELKEMLTPSIFLE